MKFKNKRSKPVIEDVIIDKEELEALNSKLKSISYEHHKIQLIRHLAGGNCCACHIQIPSKKVSIDVSDSDGPGKLVSYYCSTCFDTHYNKDKVLLTATNGKDKVIAVRKSGS